MDLTPQVINEVEFAMARKGYDPDQVDEFLERVAVAVGQLQDQLGEARERAAMAERRVADAERRLGERGLRPEPAPAAPGPPPSLGGPVDPGVAAAAEAELESLKRTLLLAQKTADAAIREAQEEASRTVASAHEQADTLVRQARAEADKLVQNAEGEARKAHDDTRQRISHEVQQLEEARNVLRGDVSALERHVDEQRRRLRSAVADLQRLLDDRLRPVEAPETSTVTVPDLADDRPAPAPAPAPAAPPAYEEPPAAVVEDEPALVPEPEPQRSSGPPPGPAPSLDDPFADLDPGPPTQPTRRVPNFDPAPSDDDAYLSELRKAMLEDTGAPDVQDADRFGDPDDPGQSRSRFGRRR
jgi:DivIVA domain-containing protein